MQDVNEIKPCYPLFGTDELSLGGYNIAFTNSALWMVITAVLLWVFVAGGMKRQLVPTRWQMAVEYFTGFINKLLLENAGEAGKKYVPYVFSLFMFILFANILGLLPLGVVGLHPFTFTSHFTVTGVLALITISIVLVVGFWKHGFHFFGPEGATARQASRSIPQRERKHAARSALLRPPELRTRPNAPSGDLAFAHETANRPRAKRVMTLVLEGPVATAFVVKQDACADHARQLAYDTIM